MVLRRYGIYRLHDLAGVLGRHDHAVEVREDPLRPVPRLADGPDRVVEVRPGVGGVVHELAREVWRVVHEHPKLVHPKFELFFLFFARTC